MGEGLVEPIASPLACAGGGAPTDTGGAGSWAHTGRMAKCRACSSAAAVTPGRL